MGNKMTITVLLKQTPAEKAKKLEREVTERLKLFDVGSTVAAGAAVAAVMHNFPITKAAISYSQLAEIYACEAAAVGSLIDMAIKDAERAQEIRELIDLMFGGHKHEE